MKNPLTLQLKDLPKQGVDLHFTKETGELNGVLDDLIGNNPYRIQIYICPDGPVYMIEGHIQTQMNLACARCALDFKHTVIKHFRESLIVQSKKSRRAAYSVPVNREDFCTVLFDPLFDLGDFLHELIAVEEPLRPLGKSDCDNNDDCENLIAFRAETEQKAVESPLSQLGELLNRSLL